MSHNLPDQCSILLPTPSGSLTVRLVVVDETNLLVATTAEIPAIPVVRFHSSCVFGESLHAIDCDCGAQLTASVELITREGGILIYAWEEGRGAGIATKIQAIALQQSTQVSTAEAFTQLGYKPEPRNFEAHIRALREVFQGSEVRFASSNPKKISALQNAGYTVEIAKLRIAMTPERELYLDHKRRHLGHLNDD